MTKIKIVLLCLLLALLVSFDTWDVESVSKVGKPHYDTWEMRPAERKVLSLP